MNWLARLFEVHLFFRRSVILIMLWMNYDITHVTKEYVMLATEIGLSSMDIISVGSVIQAPFLAVLGYTLKRYNDVRCYK